MKIRYAYIIAALAISVGTTACGGCIDDPEPAENSGANNVSDPDMGGEPDTSPDPDPDNSRPDPGLIPGGLQLQMTPGRDTYPPGIRLLPEVQMFNAYGEEAEFDYEIVVEPDGAANIIEDRYELLEEGIVRFTACTLENGPEGEPVCGWDEVVVNVGPPTIEITSPLPGAELDETNDPSIEVTGTVTDTFGDPVAFLNGELLELAPDGSFAASVEPRFGVNHIEVAATDGLDGETAEAVADVLWAADYSPPATPSVNFANAISVRLGQLFMDDRMRPITQPDGTILTQDLADLLELVIKNFDLSMQIPDPVIDQSGFFLRVPQIAIGKPLVQVDIVDGGLEIFIQIGDMQAVTDGSLTIDTNVLDLTGSLTAGMSALVIISVDKASPSDPIDVQVESLSVAVEDATPNFASAEANAIFELAQSALRTTLETLLIDSLQGTFVDQIPTLLTDVFTALDDALSDQVIDLDTGLGSPITLSIDGDVRTLDTAFRDHLTATLGLTAETDVTDVHAGSRGQALLFPDKSPPSFYQASRIQFALPFAMVNALLHTLWDAGLLEVDVTEQVPVNVDRAELSAKLPPVIRPPLDGEPHDLVIELGQIEIETELLGRVDRYGVNISTGIDFGIDQGAISLQIGDMPRIRTWLISSSEDQPFLSADALADLIEGQVWPEFTAAFAGGLSLPLPAPDLSSLGNVAAPLANLTLEFRQVLPLGLRDGWLVIDASMEGTLPPN